jgi:hypothetical protein
MGVIFVIERAAGWLLVTGWRWQAQSTEAWLQTLWLALLASAAAIMLVAWREASILLAR